MTKLVLSGGTDVAEMAIFNIDGLKDSCPNTSDIEAMEKRGQLMLYDTGADGAYLLNIYLDEEIPIEVFKYCKQEDKKIGILHLPNGRLGYGGSESMHNAFKPNSNIREDIDVPPGRYQVSAYRTEFPEELIPS